MTAQIIQLNPLRREEDKQIKTLCLIAVNVGLSFAHKACVELSVVDRDAAKNIILKLVEVEKEVMKL